MKKQKKAQNKRIRYLIGAVLVIVIAIASILLLSYKSTPTITKSKPSLYKVTPIVSSALTQRIDTGEGSYMMPTSISGQFRFVSPKLGLSFHISGPDTIKEINGKVYLYIHSYETYTSPGAKILEVFNKDPKDDLATAMQKTILKRYSSTDCIITYYPPQSGQSIDRTSAYITVPRPSDYDDPNATAAQQQKSYNDAASKCPSPYTEYSDVRTFRLIPGAPDKFVFVSAGQWDYNSGDEASNPNGMTHTTGWEGTIQFTN